MFSLLGISVLLLLPFIRMLYPESTFTFLFKETERIKHNHLNSLLFCCLGERVRCFKLSSPSSSLSSPNHLFERGEDQIELVRESGESIDLSHTPTVPFPQ
jgi:hypothetical protein